MATKSVLGVVWYTIITLSHISQVKSQLSKAFEPALTSVKVILQQFDKNVPKPIQSNLDVHY